MNNTIIKVVLGITGGIITGLMLGKRMSQSNMCKWRERMESKQLDNEIRLGLLEYNHLHERDFLRLS